MLDQLYAYHLDRANAAAVKGNWSEANTAFHAAYAVRATDDSKAKVTMAEANLLRTQTRDEADRAIASSRDLADSDPIGAYELLANLPDGPRVLVKDQMEALQKSYVQAATTAAQKLEERHRPIRGLEDESAMRKAHDYYARSAVLSGDEDFHIKQQLVAEMISNYYVGLGEKYLSKPLSSGVGVGWAYLEEAQQYRRTLTWYATT